MPIWIKYGNDLLLCDSIRISETKTNGIHSLYAYQSCGQEDTPTIIVKGLTEQQVKDLLNQIAATVASGGAYFEIPERSN